MTSNIIAKKWVGSLLLEGLPEQFAPMIMPIELSGITITTDAIKTKLIDIDDQSKISSGTQQSSFASKGWQHGNHSKHGGGDSSNATLTQTSNTRKTIKRYKCHKTGRYKNQCDLQKRSNRMHLVQFFSVQSSVLQISTLTPVPVCI
ncbi:unnamed protein product [Hermetia illucens]|uniref:Uncharacterized protein n=1 Tax=Hermetia illucens TaxID=343691 RepID=A0A7R8YRU4_HERIL|nr:unnamed protein product [Hermetia illucens]